MQGREHTSGRCRILIVEDDPLVSDVVMAALEDSYEASVVDTSADAVASLSRGGVDLVLLDCTLPDGIDARLIPQAERCGVPVVLMSGDPQRMEGVSATARACLLKPFTLTGLLSVVQEVIDGAAPLPA